MNGETEHLCNIVLSSRRALKNQEPIHVFERDYIKQSVFVFLDGSAVFSYEDWYARCCSEGLYNTALLIPVSVERRSILGFSNTSRALLICFKESSTTCFRPGWSFDKDIRKWTVVYREHALEKTTYIPSLQGMVEPFKDVLQRISAFAHEIGADEFCGTFDLAYRCLTEDDAPVPAWAVLPDLSPEQQRIWAAVSIADVFGAMGSWNDCPPGQAAQKGRAEEYEKLSDELLSLIRMNLMYVVNET